MDGYSDSSQFSLLTLSLCMYVQITIVFFLQALDLHYWLSCQQCMDCIPLLYLCQSIPYLEHHDICLLVSIQGHFNMPSDYIFNCMACYIVLYIPLIASCIYVAQQCFDRACMILMHECTFEKSDWRKYQWTCKTLGHINDLALPWILESVATKRKILPNSYVNIFPSNSYASQLPW